METMPVISSGRTERTWPSTSISISTIERELSALWKTAPGDKATDRILATRTSVLNLVVYAEGEAAASRAADTIAQLAGSHPSRAIIIAAHPQHETASLDTTLSAHCHIASSGQGKFCCEQVTIVATGEAVDHVAGVVAPLLLPDLPTVVWWQGAPPLNSRLFQRVMEVGDRLIVDVEQFGYGWAALRQVQEVRAALIGHRVLADLTWTRLRPWRALIAGLFDPPQQRPFVRHLASVRIAYAMSEADAGGERDEHPLPPSVLLLVAWIESATGQLPEVALRAEQARDQALLEGDLLSVEVEAAFDGHTLHAVLRRGAPGSTVVGETVALDGVTHEQRYHTLAAGTDSGWLARELEAHGDDPVYEAAVHYAVQQEGDR